MLLWTIQHRKAYDRLLQEGRLVADSGHLCFDDTSAYDWLSEKIAEKVGQAPEGIKYPVWAWHTWEGTRKRLDMRKFRRNFCEAGTPVVLLTIDVPDELVVLSDYDMWYGVISKFYIAFGEADDKDNATEEEIRESWDKIFEIEADTSEYWYEEKSIQATFWELRKEWVRKAEFFVTA